KMAHSLKPLLQIGKNGVTPGLIAAVDKTLADHELIKVKFLDYKNAKKELSTLLAEKTGSHLVDLIGNTAILYRPSTKPKKKKPTNRRRRK
ncbi:MAG: YhbY family RNA-binding protein, partial [Candidatus Bathyarchaeota archaeon]